MRGRMEGQVRYSVSRVGDAWVIFCDGRPILAMKNRREANQCARRAAELLAEMEARESKRPTGEAPGSGRGDTKL